jgi:hypothetical protein
MIFDRLFKLCFLMLLGVTSYAMESDIDSLEHTGFTPSAYLHTNWVFSGMVSTELGEHYAYFLQMQRHDNQFHATSALFDVQSKQLILFDDSSVIIKDPEKFSWRVGHSFLRFNAINDSWIVGLKTPDKKGFNFKIDMLNQPQKNLVAQNMRSGIDFVVVQTGQINGHIKTGKENVEQFVTAKDTWFRQIWQTNTQDIKHPLSTALCKFNDGSGFYSMNIPEPDAVRAAVAAWFDAEGLSSSMSQFVKVTEVSEGDWHIKISSPKLNFILSNNIKQNTIVAGFVDEKDKNGFCILNSDTLA